jgi:hypothetical protein
MNQLKGKIALKKNNIINKIWHPESTLVFKSATEKLVIGRFCDNEFISIDEKTLDLCVQWKFKYDTSLVDEEEVTASDDEKSDEEQNEKTIKISPQRLSVIENVTKNEDNNVVTKNVTKNEDNNVVTKIENVDNDSVTKMEHVFCNFVTSTQLLHNNFQKILFDVQQTSATAQSKLSKELEDTKESLETLMKEHEETKTKLEKIRSALGF